MGNPDIFRAAIDDDRIVTHGCGVATGIGGIGCAVRNDSVIVVGREIVSVRSGAFIEVPVADQCGVGIHGKGAILIAAAIEGIRYFMG